MIYHYNKYSCNKDHHLVKKRDIQFFIGKIAQLFREAEQTSRWICDTLICTLQNLLIHVVNKVSRWKSRGTTTQFWKRPWTAWFLYVKRLCVLYDGYNFLHAPFVLFFSIILLLRSLHFAPLPVCRRFDPPTTVWLIFLHRLVSFSRCTCSRGPSNMRARVTRALLVNAHRIKC